jgi:putative flippase GtrA
MELFWYVFSVLIMGAVDFAATRMLLVLIPFFALHWSGAKFIASLIGFIGNFILRKILVFPEKKKNAAKTK